MSFKSNSRQRKKSIQGLRSFKDTLPKDIRKTIVDKANVYSKIINNWKGIVGNELFDACFPISFNSIKNSNIKRLNIEVKRGREVDVEYARNAIIEKINEFLGYKFINKIKLITYKENKK